jgi:ABC-type polysaccharide/polyol phosphate export permease
VWVYANFVYQSLFFLCGVNFPVAALPRGFQLVSYSLPLTRGIAAAREIIAGAAWTTVAPLIFGEILIGLTYAAVGYFFFRYIEKRSFVDGQLEAI